MKIVVVAVLAAILGTSSVASGDEVFEFPDVEAPEQAPEAAVEAAAVDIQVEFGAMPVPAQPAEPGADEPQVIAMVEQLRPVLTVEVSFAKRSAELSPEQVEKLVEGCRGPLRKIAQTLAQNQNGLHGVMFMHGGAIQPRQPAGPEEQIKELVAKGMKQVASEQQQSRYEKEVKSREEFRKRAVIDQLISMYDEVLILTDEQREKIGESLATRYQPAWADNVEAIAQFSDGYFPVIPNNAVTPHLNEEQKRIWQRLQKVSASIGLGNNMWGAIPIDDVEVGGLLKPQKEGEQ